MAAAARGLDCIGTGGWVESGVGIRGVAGAWRLGKRSPGFENYSSPPYPRQFSVLREPTSEFNFQGLAEDSRKQVGCSGAGGSACERPRGMEQSLASAPPIVSALGNLQGLSKDDTVLRSP